MKQMFIADIKHLFPARPWETDGIKHVEPPAWAKAAQGGGGAQADSKVTYSPDLSQQKKFAAWSHAELFLHVQGRILSCHTFT
jgi:hypothetical protein